MPEALVMQTYTAGMQRTAVALAKAVERANTAERDRDSWRKIAEKLQEELENERKTIVYIGKKI